MLIIDKYLHDFAFAFKTIQAIICLKLKP